MGDIKFQIMAYKNKEIAWDAHLAITRGPKARVLSIAIAPPCCQEWHCSILKLLQLLEFSKWLQYKPTTLHYFVTFLLHFDFNFNFTCISIFIYFYVLF